VFLSHPSGEQVKSALKARAEKQGNFSPASALQGQQGLPIGNPSGNGVPEAGATAGLPAPQGLPVPQGLPAPQATPAQGGQVQTPAVPAAVPAPNKGKK
jgi:hypothetical protein